MTVINAEVVCPHCGTTHLLGIAGLTDPSPDTVETIKAIMAIEAKSARRRRELERSLIWIRFCWYFVAVLSAWAAFARVTGPEMISWPAAALANATTALVAFTAAAWVIDLKLWTIR
jgi:hypothetical protein